MEPITIIRHLTEQKIMKIPSPVSFECEISKADLPVEWSKDGSRLDAKSSKYKVESRGKIYRLTIKEATDEDDGQYGLIVKDTDLKSAAALIVESESFQLSLSLSCSVTYRFSNALI